MQWNPICMVSWWKISAYTKSMTEWESFLSADVHRTEVQYLSSPTKQNWAFGRLLNWFTNKKHLKKRRIVFFHPLPVLCWQWKYGPPPCCNCKFSQPPTVHFFYCYRLRETYYWPPGYSECVSQVLQQPIEQGTLHSPPQLRGFLDSVTLSCLTSEERKLLNSCQLLNSLVRLKCRCLIVKSQG